MEYFQPVINNAISVIKYSRVCSLLFPPLSLYISLSQSVSPCRSLFLNLFIKISSIICDCCRNGPFLTPSSPKAVKLSSRHSPRTGATSVGCTCMCLCVLARVLYRWQVLGCSVSRLLPTKIKTPRYPRGLCCNDLSCVSPPEYFSAFLAYCDSFSLTAAVPFRPASAARGNTSVVRQVRELSYLKKQTNDALIRDSVSRSRRNERALDRVKGKLLIPDNFTRQQDRT